MQTQVKKIDQHKQELTVQVQGDIVTQKSDKVYKSINKEAKVPGFRPGKVPRDILEKHYSDVARQEILKELVPEVYHQALDKINLEAVSLPQVSEVNLGKDSLSFKAVFEVKPEIELKNYKGLKIEYRHIQVSGDETQKAFERLKQAYAQMSDDDCARSLGYADFKALTEGLEKQIYLEKTKAQQSSLEDSIIQQLLKQVNFQIPLSLINQQLEGLVNKAHVDLALRGMSKEEIEKQTPELRKNFESRAKSQVRIFLILEEVARRENITRNDKMAQRVIEFLLRQANWEESRK